MSNLLTMKDVLTRTGLSRATIGRMVAEGRFPKPMNKGAGRKGRCLWTAEQLTEWERDGARNERRADVIYSAVDALVRSAFSNQVVELVFKTKGCKARATVFPDAALAAISTYLDNVANEARRVMETRERPLTGPERKLLRWLRESAPSRFVGLRLANGQRLLQPLSANYTNCDSPAVWLRLRDEAPISGIIELGPERKISEGLTSFTAMLSIFPPSDSEYFSKLARLGLLDESLCKAGESEPAPAHEGCV